MINFFLVLLQLRRPPLRGGEGVQQVRGLPAGGELRGQPLPELVERGVRGGRVALRAVQLGCQAPRQRQRSTQAGEGQVGEPQVSRKEIMEMEITSENGLDLAGFFCPDCSFFAKA